jgi:hypothetical protein
MNTQQIDVIFTKIQEILGSDYLLERSNFNKKTFIFISSKIHRDLVLTIDVNYSSYLLTIIDSSLTLFSEGDQLAINEKHYFVLKSKSHLINFIASNIKKMDAIILYKLHRITLN